MWGPILSWKQRRSAEAPVAGAVMEMFAGVLEGVWPSWGV